MNTFDDFQRHVEDSVRGVSEQIPYCALALSGEAGELANLVKKSVRDRGGAFGAEDRIAAILELGDVLWYVTATAKAFGVTLKQVAEANKSKLDARKVTG